MANLSEAYNTLSPYQETQIHPYTSEELSKIGYESIKPTTDNEQEMYQTLASTVDKIKRFFWNFDGSVGVDGKGKIPPFFIHLPQDNAYYRLASSHSTECFAFNNAYIQHPEVICHEFTHAIIANISPLGNVGEAGAINESIADIVGIVFKRNLSTNNDWVIGNKLRELDKNFTANDLKIETPTNANDHGHIHHNSRLLSHAFYLASQNLAGTHGYDLIKDLVGVR